MKFHRVKSFVVLLMFLPLWTKASPKQTVAPQTIAKEGVYTHLQADLNSLWLEFTGATNNQTNMSVALTVHRPSTNLTGAYGVYFSTNHSIPNNWMWMARFEAGQTNLVVSNLPPGLGFFSLGASTAIRPGFDQQILEPNDDNSTGLTPIGFNINFFGRDRTELYVNNNGCVTFDSQLGTYTPEPLLNPEAYTDIIAPFWADVDTRSEGSLPVSYDTGTVDGRVAFGVNWIDVGYFSCKFDKLNSFQLIFVDRSDRASGDYDVEFNYAQVQWETGEASGGVAGMGGAPARVGFASVSGSTFELIGSGISGSFLDDNPTSGLIHGSFNSTVPGRYVLQFHEGVPLATP